MSRPNSHSITKATDFVKQLFKKDEEKNTHFSTQKEVEPAQTLTLSARDSSKDKKSSDKYHRADTTAGVMNKFILQFSRVEQAYREIEKAFLTIVRSETQRNLKDKMKRKCEVKYIRPILEYLGYPEFSDSELKQIFNKDIESEDQVTFKRLLVGAGLCYYEKAPKKEVENWKPKSKTKTKNTNNKNDEIPNSDYDTDDEKIVSTPSIEEDDLIVDPSAARRRRFRHISQGFDVVKKMFDKIDDDASGEITHSEFKNAFSAICRDPEIVEARMAELDYNKDQEITFREFIFGIASWVGFNDPAEEVEAEDANPNLDENDENNERNNDNNDNNGNDNKNESNDENASEKEQLVDNNVAKGNGNGNGNGTDNEAAGNKGGTESHEPTATETEDASFLVAKDVLPVSPKDVSNDKNEVEKSASNEISAPPSSYQD